MQEEEQLGIGDPRELPQKLRAVLGNRFISDPLPSLGWGALLLRALGFRVPSAEEVRQLESCVEVNSDQEELSGEGFAKVLGVDIIIIKSSGAKEELKCKEPAAAKVEIFSLLKSKSFVAVIPAEARQETVREYVKKTLGKTAEATDARRRRISTVANFRREEEKGEGEGLNYGYR